MLGTVKQEQEKLVRDISYLNSQDWKRVRNYVTKLLQLEKMDTSHPLLSVLDDINESFDYYDEE